MRLEDEIKRRVSEKLEKGIYSSEEINNVSKRKLDVLLDLEIEDSFRRFHYLYGNWDITKEFQITSHRPLIGPFIVLAKKFVRSL